MSATADTNEALQTTLRRAEQRSNEQSLVNRTNVDRVVRGLGWFSVGLGLAELFAPRAVARICGTSNHDGLLRFYGLRELAAGIGILTQADPSPWLWSRVAGDAIDLASLGAALGDPGNDRGATVASIAAVAAVTALDVMAVEQMSGQETTAPITARGRAETSLIINRSPEECYRFWRDFENLPRFMEYLQSVRITGDRESHWIAGTGGNVRIEWDAEIVEDSPNQRIAWRSTANSMVFNRGAVEFEPAAGNRGTIIRVQMEYGPRGQAVASGLAKLIGKDPEQMINKDLRRFKQVIETGEVMRTEGQPAGRTSGSTWLDNIAR